MIAPVDGALASLVQAFLGHPSGAYFEVNLVVFFPLLEGFGFALFTLHLVLGGLRMVLSTELL